MFERDLDGAITWNIDGHNAYWFDQDGVRLKSLDMLQDEMPEVTAPHAMVAWAARLSRGCPVSLECASDLADIGLSPHAILDLASQLRSGLSTS